VAEWNERNTGIENIEFSREIPAILIAGVFQEELDLPHMKLVRCARVEQEGRRCWNLRLEPDAPTPRVRYRSAEFVLSADAPFAVQSMEYASSQDLGGTVRGKLEYDSHNGVSRRTQAQARSGVQS
jgi:hypothetical protein